MTILIAVFICFALTLGAYFLLLMADGRRLEKKLLERRPRSAPEGTEAEAPLFTPDHALWMAPPYTGSLAPQKATPRSLYSTTPESPGLG
jgi:hypothetical protein